MDGEKFTVYPSNSAWWRVRTNDGLEGFMHRSVVRVLENEVETGNQQPSVPATISRDETTLGAWTQYVAIQESERSHKGADSAVLLRECEKIELKGVDPVVAAHIVWEIETDKYIIALSNRVQGAVNRVKPMVELRDGLRPFARELGRKLMPDSPDLGEVAGEVLALYGFRDATTAQGLPDESTVYQTIIVHDRLLIEEGLIDNALGIEQPVGLTRLLGRVRDRAFAARIQSGRWIVRDADGSIADLETRTDPKAAWNAAGWVTMRWRQRGRSALYFQYEFAADGTFQLLDTGMGAQLMGSFAPRQILKAVFIRPTVLKVTDDKGRSMGTWEQISAR